MADLDGMNEITIQETKTARARRDPAPSLRDMVRLEVKLDLLTQTIQTNQTLITSSLTGLEERLTKDAKDLKELEQRVKKVEERDSWQPRDVYYLFGLISVVVGILITLVFTLPNLI